MAISIFLAKVLGLYFVVIALWLLIRHRHTEMVMNEMMASPGVLSLAAILGLIFGVLIVVAHNIWHLNWTLIITLIGWIALVKAFFNLFLTDVARRFFKVWLQSRSAMVITDIFMIIIGVFLLYHGFVLGR